MPTIYNFSPGPAMLPKVVLEQVQDELLNWRNLGMSIMEMPHRGPDFKRLTEEIENDFRELLNISNDYAVLFLQGGARLQFAAIPMNLLGNHTKAAYLETGIWSEGAIAEAKRYCEVQIIASSKNTKFTEIPIPDQWEKPKDAAYLHYVDNETINGVEFPFVPENDGLPLISDMSSNILSRTLDINQFGLIYAGAQKNIGPSGLTVVIVRRELLSRGALKTMPGVMNYSEQDKNTSMLNTPPTFAWYVAGLVFKWIRQQGGVKTMEVLSQKKSEKLYKFIDESGFYSNPINPTARSRMNIPFSLANVELEAGFLEAANRAGLMNLKGHRLVGGMRASLYNAMPEAGVDALIEFLQEFARIKG